jgi:hypothetical protein
MECIVICVTPRGKLTYYSDCTTTNSAIIIDIITEGEREIGKAKIHISVF